MGGAALIVTAWPAGGTAEPQPASTMVVAAAQSARGMKRTWSLFMARILSDAHPRAAPAGMRECAGNAPSIAPPEDKGVSGAWIWVPWRISRQPAARR